MSTLFALREGPRRRRAPRALALLSTVVACSVDPSMPQPEAVPDASAGRAAPADAPPGDAPGAQGDADGAERAEASCEALELIDLDLRGARSGDVTSFVGSNAAAPVVSPALAPCGGRPASVVGFRYTVRARARLVVSTYHAETTADFDTVVWAQRGCATGAPTLGCNDDVGVAYERRERPVSARFHSYFSTETIEAGATVYLFVGTYAPSLGTPPTGTFRLTLTETAEGRAGSACDPGGVGADDPRGAGCAEGTSCRPATDELSDFRCVAPLGEGESCDPRGVRSVCSDQGYCRALGTTARCERRGAVGARCRAAAPRCDGVAACSFDDTCVPVIPAGAACDRGLRANLCAAGTDCSSFEGSSRCLRPGALGGACTGADSSCDAGLACSYSVCVPALPLGAACDPSQDRSRCAEGHCPLGPAPRCTPLGGRDAPCRRTSPACDARLRCAADRCIPEVAVGERCDGSGSRRPSDLCAVGAVCASARGEARCVLAGVAGAPCRTTEDPCDAGLSCGHARLCVPTVPHGGRCDPRVLDDVCAPGSHCADDGSGARCLVDGANGRWCRAAAPACDGGLQCDGGYCRPSVALGGLCDPMGVAGVCPRSSTCVTASGVSRCAPWGTLGVRCELSSFCPTSSTCGRCRDGLDCGANFTCVPEVAAGARCDPRRERDGCGAGASCVTDRGESRCVPDGTRGGACAHDAAVCAPGLRCDSTNRCVPGLVQGSKCDPTGRLGVCAAGSSCRYRADASYCVPHGARGASGRPGSPPCDEGLVQGSSGTCVEGLPVGSACEPSSSASPCAAGAACVRGDRGDRCVADGVLGGRCRSRGPHCDPGLGCDAGHFCVTGSPVGSACDPDRRTDVCVLGASCRAAAGGPRCVVDGILDGGCRDEEPHCDAGLACAGPGVCRPALPLGASCDRGAVERACGPGAQCIEAGEGYRCFATGGLGGHCRSLSARCDEGLSCGPQFRCRAAVTLGGPCDPSGERDACALGSSCRPADGGPRCVADGVRDGSCRAGAPRCDPGLSCAPDSASPFPERRCVAAIPAGAACDPSRASADRCVDGAVCVGTGRSGVCSLSSYAVAPSTVAFIDACSVPGATVLTMGPSLPSLPTLLPFAFTFFGVEHAAGSVLTVGSSGWVRFGATAQRRLPPEELPVLFLDDAIFALWTSHTLGVDTRSPGRVCLAATGAAPSRVFVVTWNGLNPWLDTSTPLRVELQLREGIHTIDTLYRLSPMGASDPAAGATIGLLGPGATSAVQLCGGGARASRPCERSLLRDTRFSP
ncbi:MAG: hypothetical protein HY909_16640 [Deltaproteobacteria bacterium]|nr:hypothetical protein [Deltaproteobacteria bacterium]